MIEEFFSPFFEKNEVLSSSLLTGGRNNHAVKVQTSSSTYVVKTFLNPATRQKRFEREVRFLNYCKNQGITCVPDILCINLEEFSILQPFVVGKKPEVLTDFHFLEAAQFILALNNRELDDQTSFYDATDALFDGQLLFDDISRRSSILKTSNIKRAINSSLLIEFESLVESTLCRRPSILPALNNVIESSLSCVPTGFISPSDFGFHNTIETFDSLFFIDFEYSGLDSPIKLILDFMFQPDFFIAETNAKNFCNKIGESLGFVFEDISRDVRLLFAVKWLLIVMKRVSPEESSRISPTDIERYYKTRVLPLT